MGGSPMGTGLSVGSGSPIGSLRSGISGGSEGGVSGTGGGTLGETVVPAKLSFIVRPGALWVPEMFAVSEMPIMVTLSN